MSSETSPISHRTSLNHSKAYQLCYCGLAHCLTFPNT